MFVAQQSLCTFKFAISRLTVALGKSSHKPNKQIPSKLGAHTSTRRGISDPNTRHVCYSDIPEAQHRQGSKIFVNCPFLKIEKLLLFYIKSSPFRK